MLGEAMVNAQREFSIPLQQHFGVAVSHRDFVQGGQPQRLPDSKAVTSFPMKMFR
jgi:hypothetical protein